MEGSVVVLYVDECHLLWDDVRGYSWAPSKQRVDVPMTNFRERQTYYGAIDPLSGTVHVIPTDTVVSSGLRHALVYCWAGLIAY